VKERREERGEEEGRGQKEGTKEEGEGGEERKERRKKKRGSKEQERRGERRGVSFLFWGLIPVLGTGEEKREGDGRKEWGGGREESSMFLLARIVGGVVR